MHGNTEVKYSKIKKPRLLKGTWTASLSPHPATKVLHATMMKTKATSCISRKSNWNDGMNEVIFQAFHESCLLHFQIFRRLNNGVLKNLKHSGGS